MTTGPLTHPGASSTTEALWLKMSASGTMASPAGERARVAVGTWDVQAARREAELVRAAACCQCMLQTRQGGNAR